MEIRVLGCSGAIAAGSRTTAFLIDHDVLVDAGTGVGDLSLDELSRIDHILVSHSHLDHVLAIGLLADSVLRIRANAGRPPIQVHGLPETLEALRAHIFNGVIWPDFTRLPSEKQPVLRLVPFQVGQKLSLAGKTFEVLSAAHTVPAVGFGLEGRDGWWVYTGDTGPNPALWKRLAALKVEHLVIETAFSDEEHHLAQLSRHLHPAALGEELARLDRSARVHITHIKPSEFAAVMAEVARLDMRHRLSALQAGDVIHFATSASALSVTD